MIGKSKILLFAPSSTKRSNVLLIVCSILISFRSNLLITTIVFRFLAIACLRTNLVCGFGPSAASTRRRTPSTMFIMRSTSPPKSACPGVSTMFSLTSSPVTGSGMLIEAFFAKIVIPRSLSRSLESITRSTTF